LNSLLPKDIVVLELTAVTLEFHARFLAKSKVYEYRIHNGPVAPALGRQYGWHISQPLRWDPVKTCLELLEGRHNFASFQATGSNVRNAEREVFSTRVGLIGKDLWAITMEANGFLRHMVRNVVGTLVEVGREKLTEEGFSAVVAARDRKKAGMTAPARGLFLMEVRY
jgi:tRNA pseudouridine38-40 synthase